MHGAACLLPSGKLALLHQPGARSLLPRATLTPVDGFGITHRDGLTLVHPQRPFEIYSVILARLDIVKEGADPET